VVYGSSDPDNECSAIVNCFNRMMEAIATCFPAEITEDNDLYRKKRLYTYPVCNVLEKYKNILAATHIVYPVSNHKMRTKKPELKLELFGLEDFERLLSDTMMYQKGVNRSDATAAFMKVRASERASAMKVS
jgi:hypothetical protein